MKIPVFSFDGTSRDRVNYKVIHIGDVDYYVYINIPIEIAAECKLFQLESISPKVKLHPLNIGICAPDQRLWVQINTNVLDMEEGLHLYKLSYVNKYTNDVIGLYFGYIVQNDNPEKPYIYMHTESCLKED